MGSEEGFEGEKDRAQCLNMLLDNQGGWRCHLLKCILKEEQGLGKGFRDI